MMQKRPFSAVLLGLLLGAGDQAWAQNLPLRWYAENYTYQAAEALHQEAFSAARFLSRSYADYFPTLTPALPPSELPLWWEKYSQYDLLREGSEGFLEEYARAQEPSYRSDLARYHAARYAFLRGRYAETLRLEKEMNLAALPAGLQEEARFMIGYAAYREGDKMLAAQYLRPLSEKLGPYHDAANFYLGVMAYEQGDFSQAAGFLEAVQTRNPYRLAAPLWLAYSLGRLGAYERLSAAAERWLTMEPEPWYGDTLWPYVAVMLAQGGLCERAEGITPARNHPLTRWWAGVCYARQKVWEKAFGAWEGLAEREDSLGGWAAFGLAYGYAELRQWEEALPWARSAASRPGPPRDETLWLLAQTAWHLQENETGISALSAYLSLPLPPDKKREARLMLANFQAMRGSYEAALNTLGEETDSRFGEARQRIWILEGLSAWQRGALSEALRAFSQAAALNGPHTPTALLWIAETHYRLADYPAAEKAYRNFLQHPASEKHPHRDLATLYLSWTLLQQNKALEALRLTESLRNRYCITHNIGKTATFLAASAYFVQKQYESALRLFQKVLSVDAQEVQACYYAALCLMRLERYQEAEALLSEGASEIPGADRLLLLQAQLCAEHLGKSGCTRTAAEKLLRNFPASPLVPLAKARLGMALIEEGRKQEGASYLRAVLEEHADHPEAARLALEGLREALSSEAYDRLYTEFIRKLPREGATRLSFERERLEALAAEQRWEVLLREARRLRTEIPLLTDARWWEAYALEMSGDTTGAMGQYEALQNDLTYGQRALMRLASLAQARGDLSKALAFQDSLLARLPVAGFAYYQTLLGWSTLATEVGKTDTAVLLLRRLLGDTLLPMTIRQQVLLQLALAHEKAGRPDSALPYLRQVPSLEKNRWAAEALYHAARLHYDLKDFGQARQAIYQLRDEYAAYPLPRASAYLILARILINENKYSSARKLLENLRETVPTPEVKQSAAALLDSIPAAPPAPPSSGSGKKKKK